MVETGGGTPDGYPRTISAIGLSIGLIGAILRLTQYLANRSLWLDEAMLANNIVAQSFSGLVRPLDHGQVAPIGFLWIEKALVSIFGNSEFSLRLFPLVAGLIGIVLIWRLAFTCLSPLASLFALAWFAASEPLIYYASEVKPYSSDVMCTLLLLIAIMNCIDARRSPRAVIWFGIVSSVILWLSYPSVFIAAAGFFVLAIDALTANESAALKRHQLKWLAVAASLCAVSFLVLARGFMTFDAGLLIYWRDAFMPLPPWAHLDWLLRAMYGLINNLLGFYLVESARAVPNFVVAVTVAVLVVLGTITMLFRRWQLALALTTPFALALIASGLKKYPFDGRLLLFAVPLVFFLLAEGIDRTERLLTIAAPTYGVILTALIGALLFYRPLSVAGEKLAHPPMREHIRAAMSYVAQHKQPDDILYLGYLHVNAVPGVLYYASRFGFGEPKRIAGYPPFSNADEDLANLIRGKRTSRVWFILTHTCGSCWVGEGDLLLEEIDSRVIKRIETFESKDASVYLALMH